MWRILTSVRFALWLIAFLAGACLLGVLLPQLPRELRGNPAAVDAWMEVQRGRFGDLAWPLYRLGLFTVFRAPWFVAALALLVASVAVCTWGRAAPVWRAAMRPPLRVPPGFYQRGRRAQTVTMPLPPGGAAALEAALRRRHFRVRRFESSDATELFADRYAWAAFGTFASHLSIILLLAGALVSATSTSEQRVTLAEGETAGVFAPTDRRHLQIHVDAAIARFDAEGSPLEYRSMLTLMRGGAVLARGDTSVNDPLRFGGYRFHQSTMETTGAVLIVRERTTGRAVFAETLNLTGSVPVPVVDLRRGDETLFSGVFTPTRELVERLRTQTGIFLRLEGEPRGERRSREQVAADPWALNVSSVLPGTDRLGAGRTLRRGESVTDGDLSLRFERVVALPALTAPELPGFPFGALLQLAAAEDGTPLLLVHDGAGPPLELDPGVASNVDGALEYTFLGPRNVTGITIRRDPGTPLVWIAVALLIGGLAVTFYVPRRRLWLRITGESVAIAAQAGMAMNELERVVSSE